MTDFNTTSFGTTVEYPTRKTNWRFAMDLEAGQDIVVIDPEGTASIETVQRVTRLDLQQVEIVGTYLFGNHQDNVGEMRRTVKLLDRFVVV